MRLRLFLYALLAVPAVCAGCMSVEISTRADRNGGGTRTYVTRLDPSLAKTYESANAAGKLFRLPGDDLVGKPGVALVSQSQDRDTSGILAVTQSFRAARLSDMGTAADSISCIVVRRGMKVTYSYREHYLPGNIDSSRVTGSYGERYRFRHVLRLPGALVATNADSARSGEAIWSRPMRQVRAEGLVMTAESREIDPMGWAVLAGCILAAGMLVMVLTLRRTVLMRTT